MKYAFLSAFLFFTVSVFADQTTIPNSGEDVEGNVKYCYYSNGGHDFSITVKKYQNCPATKTFDLDDEE